MFKKMRSGRTEKGQVLVIVAVGMLVMIAMVGVVIDGGYAWGKQRDTQNASDAAAEAGTAKLAANLPFLVARKTTSTTTLPNDNAAVAQAVTDAATTNGVSVLEAWYTDFDGTRVGAGPLIGTSALAATEEPPADADGVEVTGSQQFKPFIAQIVGISNFTATTKGTAHAGYWESVGAGVLPVTFPLNIMSCSNTNNFVKDPSAAGWTPDETYIIPLCSKGPGNVGWLDWEPPHGGTDELEQSILHPNNPEIHTPKWYYIAETGNVSAPKIQNALETYAPGDQVVIIPIFDATCQDEPLSDDKDACTSGQGTGQNQWYHLAAWAGFDIEWVDLNGGKSKCGSGNGSTGCFQGQFKYFAGMPDGTLKEATGTESLLEPVGVALIDSK